MMGLNAGCGVPVGPFPYWGSIIRLIDYNPPHSKGFAPDAGEETRGVLSLSNSLKDPGDCRYPFDAV